MSIYYARNNLCKRSGLPVLKKNNKNSVKMLVTKESMERLELHICLAVQKIYKNMLITDYHLDKYSSYFTDKYIGLADGQLYRILLTQRVDAGAKSNYRCGGINSKSKGR